MTFLSTLEKQLNEAGIEVHNIHAEDSSNHFEINHSPAWDIKGKTSILAEITILSTEFEAIPLSNAYTKSANAVKHSHVSLADLVYA